MRARQRETVARPPWRLYRKPVVSVHRQNPSSGAPPQCTVSSSNLISLRSNRAARIRPQTATPSRSPSSRSGLLPGHLCFRSVRQVVICRGGFTRIGTSGSSALYEAPDQATARTPWPARAWVKGPFLGSLGQRPVRDCLITLACGTNSIEIFTKDPAISRSTRGPTLGRYRRSVAFVVAMLLPFSDFPL